MRASIGVMAILLFGGCITTFQTAEVLSEGESVVAVGSTNLLYYEVFYRRGIGNKMDIGLKAGISDFDVYSLIGEVKYQFAHQPAPVALVLSGGVISIAGPPSVWLYPTLLP